MDYPRTRNTDHSAAHHGTGSGGSGDISALPPSGGAARDAWLDALIHLCGQAPAVVDAGIAAVMNRRRCPDATFRQG